MLPSRMGPVITLLGKSVGTFDDVIKHNMLIPLAARFIPPEDTESIVSHFIEGPRGGLASKLGMAGQASGWAKHRLLRCVKCLKDDIGSCGKPFWRRDHLLPGILFCGKHEIPLCLPCDLCANYASFSNRTLHAGHHCGCGLKPLDEAALLTDAQAEVEIELARIASRLLDADHLPTLNFQRVANETHNAATELGLVRDGLLRHTEAREFLMASPSSSLLRRAGILKLGSGKFAAFLKGEQVFRHPIPAIALLTSLAGEWRAIERRVAAQTETGGGIKELKAKAEVVDMDMARTRAPKRIAKDIERYKRLRAEHPEFKHTELRGNFSNAAKRYLTRELLIAAGVDVPPRVTAAVVSDTHLVEMLITHIEQRSQQLRAALHPNRITAISLMTTFYRPRIFDQKGMVKRLSLAHEVLLRHTETHVGWRKRLEAIADRRNAQFAGNPRNPTEAEATGSVADQEN
jgi:hypothetical protein